MLPEKQYHVIVTREATSHYCYPRSNISSLLPEKQYHGIVTRAAMSTYCYLSSNKTLLLPEKQSQHIVTRAAMSAYCYLSSKNQCIATCSAFSNVSQCTNANALLPGQQNYYVASQAATWQCSPICLKTLKATKNIQKTRKHPNASKNAKKSQKISKKTNYLTMIALLPAQQYTR